uniref:Uncharacterized protein n=1 Tax=Nomascus leucogenys TaxID=61853 RepID=A0A2I3G926_NOMLE
MPLLSEGASDSIVSSVLVCCFRACNTFMNAPSGFPTDASSAVRKEETLYAPVTQSKSQQTFECHSERRNIHPNLNL